MPNPKTIKTKNRKPIPFHEGIILRELREEKTAGGIYLPEVKRDELRSRGQSIKEVNIGEVLAVGEGGFTDAGVQLPMPFNVGDHVAYVQNSVYPYKLDGELYLIGTLHSVVAKIEDAPY